MAEYLNSRANVEAQFQGQEGISIDEQLTKSGQFPEFKYSHKGNLAYVGNERVIADLLLFQWSLPSAGAGKGEKKKGTKGNEPHGLTGGFSTRSRPDAKVIIGLL